MPVKQAEMSSWRRVASVLGWDCGGSLVVVLFFVRGIVSPWKGVRGCTAGV
jgi:hypothetical protein